MRIRLLITLITLISTIALAQDKAVDKITVKVTGVDINRGGNLIVLVLAEEGFPIRHQKALLTRTLKADRKEATVTFVAPPDRELAFKVLHDEDANNKVTKNWTGIWPKEGLGFSNGATMKLTGPPRFARARLAREKVLAGVSMRIIYPDADRQADENTD